MGSRGWTHCAQSVPGMGWPKVKQVGFGLAMPVMRRKLVSGLVAQLGESKIVTMRL